jgi:hypothetical protein
MAQTQQRPPFVDRPEIEETFVDGIHSITTGGGVIRVNLTVVRSDGEVPQKLSNVLSNRLVLTLPAAAELHQMIGRTLTGLQEQSRAATLAPAESKADE